MCTDFLPLAVRSEFHQLYKLNSTRNLNMEKTSAVTIHSNTRFYKPYCNSLCCIPAIFHTRDKSFSPITAEVVYSKATWHRYESLLNASYPSYSPFTFMLLSCLRVFQIKSVMKNLFKTWVLHIWRKSQLLLCLLHHAGLCCCWLSSWLKW